jgi:general secretion pathway protein L
VAGAATSGRNAFPPASTGATLLIFAGEDGVPREWRLVAGGAVIGSGDAIAELPEQRDWVRVVLAVPGTDVTLRWLDLADSLTLAQAAAAARLQIADETAEPLADLHVVAGRPEGRLTPIALAPAGRMQGWIAAAQALAMEPDVVIPAPLLLLPPGEGLVRLRRDEGPADYRGLTQAFSMEPELAGLITGDALVRDIDENAREAGLGPALADPVTNLRQGPFARRREVVLDRRAIRRFVLLTCILLLISVLIQVVMILRTVTAADRVEAEAQQLLAAHGGGSREADQPQARFGVLAGALLDAVRQTPAAEVTQIAYLADGSLRASILADAQATIDALRARIEASGMQAAGSAPTNVGGRTAGEIMIRPR